MSPSQTIPDFLSRAFVPTPRGIVGLVDQLLAACAGDAVEFERIGDRCVCRWSENGDTHEATIPLPLAAFRPILARVAVLCNEHRPNSVSPYGGDGVLTLTGDTTTVLRVTFVNTPDQQQLKLHGNR